MPLGGLLAISVIWVFCQFAVANSARSKLGDFKREHARISKELKAFAELPGRLAKAESDRDLLKLRAAAVTALTHSTISIGDVLEAVAQATPEGLRLTTVGFDYDQGTATIIGYGAEDKADFQVTQLLRSLNTNAAILKAFSGATFNYCNSATINERPVKRFSVSLEFRSSPMRRFLRKEEPAEAAESPYRDGSFRRSQAG
jgi:hypothetical protein